MTNFSCTGHTKYINIRLFGENQKQIFKVHVHGTKMPNLCCIKSENALRISITHYGKFIKSLIENYEVARVIISEIERNDLIIMEANKYEVSFETSYA